MPQSPNSRLLNGYDSPGAGNTGRCRIFGKQRMSAVSQESGPNFVLTLERVLDAAVEKLWHCWTEPELLEQWFCPKPWFVTDIKLDLQPGGEFSMVINGPDGERFPDAGVVLAVEPRRRLVTTDAFRPGWIPSERAFMVAETCFAPDSASRTRYTARAMHWDEAARKEHEQMGFREGWGKATDQLEALARSL